MEKVKAFFKSKSLKTSFFLYVFVCLLIALILSMLSSALCSFGQNKLYRKYEVQYEAEVRNELQIKTDDGVGTLYYATRDITELFTDFERIAYNVLSVLSVAMIPVWFLLCMGMTSWLFYKRNLQKPMVILDTAANNIADNNLDFEISYQKENEMGRLCKSFEKMRAALQENNFEMWRGLEERKRLNAAFSHDLRTPLTVLKGQSEMLMKYVPDGTMGREKIAATAATMNTHILRLEEYVATMNRLQKLEDIEIKKTPVSKEEIVKCLEENGHILCKEKELIFDTGALEADTFFVDMGVVMQVYENLLANGVRFATSKVKAILSGKDGFSITIQDDGKGFSSKDLQEATKPFYRSDEKQAAHHYGMGLNICKILCEKHGGYLRLTNQTQGASAKAVFY